MAQEANGDPYDLKVLWEITRDRSLWRPPIPAAERILVPGLVIGWRCIDNPLTNSMLFYVHCESCGRSFEDCVWSRRATDVTSAQEILKQTLVQYVPDCPHIGEALPDLADMSPEDLMPAPEKGDDSAAN